jgi:hypothetical protein
LPKKRFVNLDPVSNGMEKSFDLTNLSAIRVDSVRDHPPNDMVETTE